MPQFIFCKAILESNMRCLSLSDLPSPMLDETGWQWTEESKQVADVSCHNQSWPRISIITPSYNQGQFIEETIRSVLLQGYPNLEYIVIDGGSTDNSVQVIQKYEKHLAYWISEADEGQADAIGKGLAIATGEIESYLNSDDILLPGALHHLAKMFSEKHESIWVSGTCAGFKTNVSSPEWLWEPKPAKMPDFIFGQSVAQPSTFWRSAARREVGFDTTYHFCLDNAFFCRLLHKYGPPVFSTEILAGFRLHDAAKTATMIDTLNAEIEVNARYWATQYKGLQRVRLIHMWKTWRTKAAFLSYVMGKRCFGRKLSKAELLRMVMAYPPGILNRLSLSAIWTILRPKRKIPVTVHSE